MSNPLFNQLGGNVSNNGIGQMMQQFQQFKQTLNRNPKDMVMEMLSNGKITQTDLNNAQAFAKQFGSLLK